MVRAGHSAATTAESEPIPADANPSPVKKKRGRPPKKLTVPASTATESTSILAAPPKKPPTKRAAKRPNPASNAASSSNTGDIIKPTTEDNIAPPAKRLKASDQIPNFEPPSRDPLPSRPRNSHPGKPDLPRPKRSSAEVQAALKELEAIEARKAEIQARQIQLYAELEIEDEASQEAESRNVVRSLAQVQEEGPEEFSFTAINAEESEEDDSEDEAEEKKRATNGAKERPKKGSKLKAGDLRSAIDAVKDDLHTGKRKALAIDSTVRTAKKQKPTVATGLHSDWRDRAPEKSQRERRGNSATHDADNELGGFVDADVEADPPLANTDQDNDNRMVQFINSEDEVEAKVTVKPVRAKPKAPRSPIKQNARPPVKTTQKIRGAAKPPSIKREETPLAAPVGVSRSREKMTEVPRFMEAAWSSAFLPTIYDSLGRSKRPFADFSKGLLVVSKLQEAIDLVWPGTDYTIQWSDYACTKAVDRLNEKRGWFGAEAFKLVDRFFQGPEYVNNPSKIMKYALWATRGDGPALYSKPTPMACITSDSDPDYIRPDGIFKSEFVVKVMTAFLASIKGSRNYEEGFPEGALAMTSIALERAFTAYHCGVKTNPGQFSRENCETGVDDYIQKTIAQLGARRWRTLLDVWGKSKSEAPVAFGESSRARRQLYLPPSSSPAKD